MKIRRYGRKLDHLVLALCEWQATLCVARRGTIAKALCPDADIRAQPFEQSKLADGFYDLAISNVPFGDYPVHDPRWNNYKFPIHDHFFAASLEKVRPGGLV